MKVSDIYIKPTNLKLCLLCNKEISTKWRDDLCENCRTKLELNPEKFKDILKLFEIHNHQKDDGGCQMAKEKQSKTKEEKVEDKKTYINFFESEMSKLRSELGLGKEAKRGEISNAIRKKLGMEERKAVRLGKRQALIKKLGLDDDATQKDINDAVMELELE